MREKNLRISDIVFFGTIFIVMIYILVSVLFGWEIPEYFTYYWLSFLAPIALVKVFLPNSKMTKWFFTPRW